MNAPHLTRRDVTAALGGVVLSFSLSPRLTLAQEAKQRAKLPGSLDQLRDMPHGARISR